MLEPNRSALARLRGKKTPEAMESWPGVFAGEDRALADRYARAFEAFLGDEASEETYIGKLSPRTRTSYLYAVSEFFEWIARERGRVVPPHLVTQKDAEDYANWLATRKYSLEEEKLKDGDQPVRLALYEAVKKLGMADISAIWKVLPESQKKQFSDADGVIAPSSMHHELGRMVLHDLLARTPTLEELRAEHPQLGISEFAVRVKDGDTERSVSMEYLFQYSLPKPVPVSRVTIVVRLTALSSLWRVMMRGENAPGGEAILRYDVFEPVKERVSRGLSFERREASARANQLSAEVVGKALAVTQQKRLNERRDVAILWFLTLSAVRVSEAIKLRRAPPPPSEEHRVAGWFDGTTEPPVVVVRRKGGKVQRLPYPPIALKALYAFQAELEQRAAGPEAQSDFPNEENYLQPDSPRWRFRQLLEDDAPLFPGISYWGANSTKNHQALKPNLPHSAARTIDYRRGLTRHAVWKILKRLARKAGLSEADIDKMHPHALRSFAATAMARMGKPLIEIKDVMGHESIQSTERYVAPEERLSALSGQAEVLSYIAQARAAAPAPGVEPPGPPPAMPKRRTVETTAVPAPPPAPAPAKPPIPAAVAAAIPPAPPPEHMPAESPVLPDLAEVIHATGEGTIVEVRGEPVPAAASEIRDGLSPGSPYDVYAGLEPTPGLSEAERLERQEKLEFTRAWPRRAGESKLATLYEKRGREQVQQNPWLRRHYDPWPLHYGLGEASLLPWYARGNSKANGEVETSVSTEAGDQVVRVPPIPVLAPDQVYPETTMPGSLLTKLEELSRRWIETDPTKVYGLRRWYGALAYITARLEKETKQKYRWVPFDQPAKVGEDIRAHDDEYLARWFELNAGRYTTTVRLFKADIKRPRKIESYADAGDKPETRSEERDEAEAFLTAFDQTTFESVSQVEEIPEWFALEDPVKDIYDRSPEEWSFFLEWLRSVTGAKLSEERKENRLDQKEFAGEQLKDSAVRARKMLETYYQYVDDLAAADADGNIDDKKTFAAILFGGKLHGKEVEGLTEQLAKMGIQDPKTMRDGTVAQRIEKLIAAAFPEAPVELADPNMLRSRLFDPEAFRIEPRAHTISHTDAFKEAFAEEHGRDSECVLRRAARGMWEFVKKHRIEVAQGRKRAEQYAMLHAVMLAYVAWIVPCPADMEKAFGERMQTSIRRRTSADYLRAMNDAVRRIFTGDPERTEQEIIDEVAQEANLPAQEAARAFDIAAVMAAEIADHAVPIEVAAAQAVARGDLQEEQKRFVRRRAQKNAVLLIPNESKTVCYRCSETLSISHGAVAHAATLVPNRSGIFPEPMRMMAAMLAT